MISHERAQELISARMDAPLGAADHRALQAHLATCDACRVFVAQADELARGMQVMPRLGPSPAVSRAVMSAVYAENAGWGWLRRSLQLLSSPGLAVASGLAVTVALAATLLIVLNGSGDRGRGEQAESTIAAAVAIAPEETAPPIATEPAIATEPVAAPPTETPPPTAAPTATREVREIQPGRTPEPVKTPVPRPTATAPTIVSVGAGQDPTAEQPVIEPSYEEPLLASADVPVQEEPVEAALAQEAVVEEAQPAAALEEVPAETGGGEEIVEAPVATEAPALAAADIPDEAIAAVEDAGDAAPNVYVPIEPLIPPPPDQAFLPITPTPASDGTPTPDSAEYDPESGVPQLADDPSAELGVAALAPEAPANVVDITVDEERIRSKEKRDKSSRDGKSHENQQSAYPDGTMGWSAAAVTDAGDAALFQTTDEPTAYVEPTTSPVVIEGEPAATSEEPLQIDPATGMEIDPTTGLLIDANSGYLFDPATGYFYERRTGYQVHPMTGLLIDPTGAQLDPITLAVVIPAGFGSDQPIYVPGSDGMRDAIETNVDQTYDDATYKVIPPTDGPVQPVGEIIVPTESGESLEIE